MIQNEIILQWEPYPWQAEVVAGLKLRTVVICARQVGKTTMLQRLLLGYACDRPYSLYYYVSPTIQLGKEQFYKFKNLLIGSGAFQFKDTDRLITCPNGARIMFKSFEQGDDLRGPSVDGIVLDEVGTMTKRFVADIIEPMTTHTGGWIVYCGTCPDPLEVPDPMYFEKLAIDASRTNDPLWGYFKFDFRCVADLPSRGATYRQAIKVYLGQHGEDSYGWKREYLVKFVRTDEISLPFEKLRWYADHAALPKSLETVILVDPSFSDKEAADPRAIVTTGLCPDGDLYVMRAEQGRWGYDEFVARIYRHYNEAKAMGWNPQWIGIEKAGVGLPFIKAMERIGEKSGHLPIKEIPNYGSTLSRIMSLEPWMQGSRIVLYEGSEGCKELSDQVELFPRGLLNAKGRSASLGHHFDVLNALAFRTVDFYPPPRLTPIREEIGLKAGEFSFEDDIADVLRIPDNRVLTFHVG